jgi:hypothetical protein
MVTPASSISETRSALSGGTVAISAGHPRVCFLNRLTQADFPIQIWSMIDPAATLTVDANTKASDLEVE